MMLSKKLLSFTDKRVSKNALFTVLLGTVLLLGFLILILASVLTKGTLGIGGGLLGCIFVVLALFGVIWGVINYDEARTSNTLKIPGICLNIVVIFLGLTFFMM